MNELWQFALAGLAGGGAFALTALGVVAVYRGSGILNFSQGAIGMIGAYVFWDLSSEGDGTLPVVPSFVIGVLVGAALGVLFYAVVVRLLRNASAMAKVVATLGFMLLLQGVAVRRYGTESHLTGPLFKSGTIRVWEGFITYDTLALLIITLVLAAALAYMFSRTRLGINATALRENPVAASAIGISPHPTGLVTWGVGGALAAIAGILLIPVIGLTPTAMTLLVIPAMAAALVGGFTRIATTVAVGLGLGILQSALLTYDINTGIRSSIPFAVIIVAVVLGGRALPGRGEALTIRLPRVGNGRIRPMKMAVWVGLGIVIPLVLSPTWSTAMINSALFGLLALSMVVVTGYAGQISVAAAALAGFGSFIAARVSSDLELPFLVCVVFGTLAAVALGVIFGGPAVRVRGVNLAIVTLGLSLAVENLVLLQPTLTGGIDGLKVQPPTLFGLDISPAGQPHRYAIVCVVGLALGVLAVLNLRRGEAGRRYLAVRANERGAASVGLSVPGAKLGAFATSAGLAGLAGSLATFQFSIADFTSYGVFQSITALAFTVVGGIGYVAGAIFAAVSAAGGLATNLIVNELEIGTIDLWLPILSGVFVIDVMVRFPDGIIMQFVGMKDAIAKRLPTRRRPEPVVRAAPGDRPTPTLPRVSDVPAGETVLAARDVRVTYGNVVAVNDVSFELAAGQVVGVIGPNGAGKTSLIDALTGFAPMAKGTIEFRGRRLGGRGAVARARLGMARTFQNLELFDDLSVRENILTALDSRSRLAYARDLVHPGRGELNDAARAAVAMLDLDRDLDTVAADLPQGRRRMVAIARLVAQQPSVVMLDEPAAGLNGGERRTACEVFRALADQLGVAVLLVEHNVDVVSTTCDHLIVLDFGRVIASGPTAEVLRDPAVRAAYLGRLTPEREAAAEAAVTTDV